ncbi:early nodulin-like protein 2 [Carassius auratus]|uniref:Early nodulin-like protein 2 n=1 Tax=Carassius auratus TaxID=7957 RepID=A0A6P6JHW7_CARAU|nr:early nodulin-like protein 2 [Carassius auratus]
MGESSATNSTETPPADSTQQITCNVSNKDKEASSMGESSATNSTETETSPEDSTADPASELTPESDTVLLPLASSSLASLVSFTTPSLMSLSIASPVSPLTHPAFVSSQSSPISSSSASPLPPASNLSTLSKLSTEQGSSGPVVSSRKKKTNKEESRP